MAHENGINGGDTDSESVELNPLRRTRFHVNRVDSLEGRASLLGEQETKKSLRYMTREALPRLDNYRNIMSIQAAHRPSLDELHNPTLLNKNSLLLTWFCERLERLNRTFTLVARCGSVNGHSKKRTPNKSRASDR